MFDWLDSIATTNILLIMIFFAIVLDIGGPVSRGANYAYEIKGKLDDINDKLSKLVDKEDNKD